MEFTQRQQQTHKQLMDECVTAREQEARLLREDHEQKRVDHARLSAAEGNMPTFDSNFREIERISPIADLSPPAVHAPLQVANGRP